MLKKIITFFIPEKIKHLYRLKKYPEYKERFERVEESKRLKKLPRFVTDSTFLLGKKLKLVDAASFLFIYDELFNKEIYKFKTTHPKPYIIDAGANIGLSIIYFKKLYPNAEIIAFEPDNKVFEALQYNITSFGLEHITPIKKALWNEETVLKFYSEGADGGRIAIIGDKQQIIEIQTERLRSYLNRKVDLLKIDIEGAETTVLEDCADLLYNVERLFVEYHSFLGQEQKLGNLLQILSKAGFRYQVQHIGIFSSHPFVNISNSGGMDLQLNIFAYRV